jgi:hypothetical protein
MNQQAQEALALTLQPGVFKLYSELCAEKETAKKTITDADRRKLFAAHAAGDKDAASEVSAAIKSEVNLNILGQLFAMSMFDIKTYADPDWPWIRAKRQDFNYVVSTIGLDGGTPQKQMIEGIQQYQLYFKSYVTEETSYQLFDLQTGQMDYFADAIADITYALGLHLDKTAKTLLDSNQYASGLRDLINLHPSIVAANIPDANYLDLSTITGGASAGGQFTTEKVKRILDYCNRWTSDVQPMGGGELSGSMRVKSVHCSSRRMRDLYDLADAVALVGSLPTGEANFVTSPSQTIPEDARGQIFRSGKLETWWGAPFTLVPNNRLAADEVYVAMNRPAGVFHHKPSMDEVFRDQSPKLRSQNRESVYMKKVGVFHQTNSQIPNFLVVKL